MHDCSRNGDDNNSSCVHGVYVRIRMNACSRYNKDMHIRPCTIPACD